MKAAISSVENRSDGNNIIFELDESNFNREAERVIAKDNALDGTVITTNWGYPEGNVQIDIGNIILSRDNYNTLVAMKEDDSYTYLFTYRHETWRVLIRTANGFQTSNKDMLCLISLSVIEKYSDMETS